MKVTWPEAVAVMDRGAVAYRAGGDDISLLAKVRQMVWAGFNIKGTGGIKTKLTMSPALVNRYPPGGWLAREREASQ